MSLLKTSIAQSDLRQRTALLSMTLLLLVIAVLGTSKLNADPLWYDEWSSIYRAGGAHYGPLDVGTLVTNIAVEDPWVAPAYFVVLSGWGQLTGWSPFAVRVLSLLLGLLAVTVIYRLGRDMFSRFAGLGAFITVGFSAFVIYYLHEARFYTAFLLLASLSLWLVWRILQGRTGRWAYGALFLTVALLPYTHYFGGLWAFALGVTLLAFAPKDRRWLGLVLAFVAAALAFMPWLATLLRVVGDASTDPRQADALSPIQAAERLLFMVSNGGVALLIGLVTAAMIDHRRLSVRLTVALAVIFLTLAFTVNAALGVLTEMRYLIAAWIPLALLAGHGLDRVRVRGVPAKALLAAWVVVGIWGALRLGPLLVSFNAPESSLYNRSFASAFQPMPWDDLRSIMVAREKPGDVLLLHRPDAVWATAGVFDYYTHDLTARHTILEQLPGRDQDNEFVGAADSFIADAPRVWLAIDTSLPPNFRLEATRMLLAGEGYQYCEQAMQTDTMTLDLYAREQEPDWQFGDGIGVHLVEAHPSEQAVQIVLSLIIGSDTLREALSYGVYVLRDGALIAQTDAPLPTDSLACTSNRITLDTPLQENDQVALAVYDWSTGQRLPVHPLPSPNLPPDTALLTTISTEISP